MTFVESPSTPDIIYGTVLELLLLDFKNKQIKTNSSDLRHLIRGEMWLNFYLHPLLFLLAFAFLLFFCIFSVSDVRVRMYASILSLIKLRTIELVISWGSRLRAPSRERVLLFNNNLNLSTRQNPRQLPVRLDLSYVGSLSPCLLHSVNPSLVPSFSCQSIPRFSIQPLSVSFLCLLLTPHTWV